MNHSSDPLPFMQIDRAVKPKAALLANAMGVTNQHALGSLVEFWDLCGDPREIEKLVVAGQEEIVLPGTEVKRRFRLASGHELDLEDMATIGLLEPRGDCYRVRGMSRYFEPVKQRMEARLNGSTGGKASVESRRKKSGSAQPGFSAPPSTPPRSLAEPPLQPPLEATSKLESKPTEAEDRGQRTEDRDLNTYVDVGETENPAQCVEAPPPRESSPIVPVAPTTPRSGWTGEDFWRWAQFKRWDAGLAAERGPPIKVNAWHSGVMMELNGDFKALEEAFYRFGEDEFWQKADPPLPFNAFKSQWSKYVPRRSPHAAT